MSLDPLLTAPTEEELAHVDAEIGSDKDVRSYLMLRLVVDIFKRRQSFAALKERIMAGANQPEIIYTAAFSACWRHLDVNDERPIVLKQLQRYLFSKQDEERDFSHWLAAHPRLASKPQEVFYALTGLPDFIRQHDFAPIWNSLSSNTRRNILAIWWKVINCACRVKTEYLKKVIVHSAWLPNDVLPILSLYLQFFPET